MKFITALALLVAAGVSAQDTNCEAEYIVRRCLSTETDKAKACASADYDCLCAAYQAIATCYNNCPNDSRAPAARDQVTTYCRNASMYNTKTTTSTSGAAATADATPSTTLVNLGDSDANTPTNTAPGGEDDGSFQAGPSSTDNAAALPQGAGNAAFAAGLAGLVMAML